MREESAPPQTAPCTWSTPMGTHPLVPRTPGGSGMYREPLGMPVSRYPSPLPLHMLDRFRIFVFFVPFSFSFFLLLPVFFFVFFLFLFLHSTFPLLFQAAASLVYGHVCTSPAPPSSGHAYLNPSGCLEAMCNPAYTPPCVTFLNDLFSRVSDLHVRAHEIHIPALSFSVCPSVYY